MKDSSNTLTLLERAVVVDIDSLERVIKLEIDGQSIYAISVC